MSLHPHIYPLQHTGTNPSPQNLLQPPTFPSTSVRDPGIRALFLQVVDGFFVKYTQDLRETAAYLTLLTRHLARLYGVRRGLQVRSEAPGRVGGSGVAGRK